MGSPLFPQQAGIFSSNILFSSFKLIENGLIYTDKITGKQYILFELL